MPDAEQDQYRDTGCELWHACLSCPFPVCGEELPDGIAGLKRRLTYQVVAWLLEDGHSARAVARRLGLSTRHVWRIKAALKREPALWSTAAWHTHPAPDRQRRRERRAGAAGGDGGHARHAPQPVKGG
jgi:hypothetical protein